VSATIFPPATLNPAAHEIHSTLQSFVSNKPNPTTGDNPCNHKQSPPEASNTTGDRDLLPASLNTPSLAGAIEHNSTASNSTVKAILSGLCGLRSSRKTEECPSPIEALYGTGETILLPACLSDRDGESLWKCSRSQGATGGSIFKPRVDAQMVRKPNLSSPGRARQPHWPDPRFQIGGPVVHGTGSVLYGGGALSAGEGVRRRPSADLPFGRVARTARAKGSGQPCSRSSASLRNSWANKNLRLLVFLVDFRKPLLQHFYALLGVDETSR
jgi:hypothetical protein